MNPVAAALQSEILGFVLEASRILGLVLVAPLAWSQAPGQVKVGLILTLTLVAHGIAPAAAGVGASPVTLALAVFSELIVGLALGFLVRLVVSSVDVMGDAIAPTMGFSMARVFDPTSGTGDAVPTTLLRYLVILLMLGVGLHRDFLAAVIGSFRYLPPGTLIAPGGAAPTLLELSARALDTGVRMALPILAVLVIVQVGLAFISRAAPAMQIFSIGFTVTLMVGLLLMAAVLPDVARESLAQMSHLDREVERLLHDFGARAP